MYRDEVEANIIQYGIPSHRGELKVFKLPLNYVWLCQYTQFAYSVDDTQLVCVHILQPVSEKEVETKSKVCRVAKDTFWHSSWRDLSRPDSECKSSDPLSWDDVDDELKNHCSLFSDPPNFIIFRSEGSSCDFQFSDNQFWKRHNLGWTYVRTIEPKQVYAELSFGISLKILRRVFSQCRENDWWDKFWRDPEEIVIEYGKELVRIGQSVGWTKSCTKIIWSYLYQPPKRIDTPVLETFEAKEMLMRPFVTVASASGNVLVYDASTMRRGQRMETAVGPVFVNEAVPINSHQQIIPSPHFAPCMIVQSAFGNIVIPNI